MGDDRPFVCNAPGCGQRFTNEDHLAVHKHKHEMTLKFGPARTDSVIIADQTPTPTRFLKNCEEVGLFNELASSFEHEFKKAAEDDEKKARGEGRQRCPKSEPCDISGPGGMELV
uniref:C2H2-type domain-containing protein n=1 Tax=Anas platyrhynchos platyrhynchos TaxID=8840 RepID=A0A493TDT1_ANAPP